MAIKWTIDPAHSEIQFKVKHLMITTVTGYFRKYELEVETETDDFNTAKKIEFTADIDSIDTIIASVIPISSQLISSMQRSINNSGSWAKITRPAARRPRWMESLLYAEQQSP